MRCSNINFIISGGSRLKRFISFIMIILIIGVYGCSTGGVDTHNKKDTGIDEAQDKQADISDIPTQTDNVQPNVLDDVERMVKLGDDVEIDRMDMHYKCKVKSISFTKHFKQDMSEWSIPAKVSVENGRITNGYTIIYINAEVTNMNDKELSYCASEINPVAMVDQDGKRLWPADNGDLQYFDRMGKGKSAYIIKAAKGKTEEFNIGYIIEDQDVNRPLYLELTSACSSDAYILLPIEDKTLED